MQKVVQNFQSSGVSLVNNLLLFLSNPHIVSSKGFFMVIFSEFLDQYIILKIFRLAIILREPEWLIWYSTGLWAGWLGFNYQQEQVLEGKATNKHKIRWKILAKNVGKGICWAANYVTWNGITYGTIFWKFLHFHISLLEFIKKQN